MYNTCWCRGVLGLQRSGFPPQFADCSGKRTPQTHQRWCNGGWWLCDHSDNMRARDMRFHKCRVMPLSRQKPGLWRSPVLGENKVKSFSCIQLSEQSSQSKVLILFVFPFLKIFTQNQTQAKVLCTLQAGGATHPKQVASLLSAHCWTWTSLAPMFSGPFFHKTQSSTPEGVITKHSSLLQTLSISNTDFTSCLENIRFSRATQVFIISLEWKGLCQREVFPDFRLLEKASLPLCFINVSLLFQKTPLSKTPFCQCSGWF